MKNENKGLIITIVILLVCVLGLGGYIICDKLFLNDSKTIVNKMSDEEIEALGKTLWDKYSIVSCNNYLFLNDELSYDSEKMLTKNMLGDVVTDKRLIAALTGITPTKTWKESESVCEEFFISSKCNFYSYSLSDFNESYAKLFGADKVINKKAFGYSTNLESLECDFKDGNLVCHEIAGGGCTGSSPEAKVIKTNLIDDKIEVIVENKIINYFSKEVFYNYKLIFSKDKNNNWYWVSTNLVQ